MTADHTFVDSTGTTVTGRDAMAAGWRQYFRMFPDYRIEVDAILSEGDLVAILGSAMGTYVGTSGPVAENRVEMPAAWRAVVEDGKVKRWQVYADWTEGRRIIEADRRGR